jgi:hypothetical protein
MLRMVVLLLMLSGTALAASGAARLPDDVRLAPVRIELQRRIDSAAAAGLPVDVLVSKVREGLAKGVDPQRIASAVTRLADHLEAAQGFVNARRPGAAAPGLVRALAEAKMAGLDLETLRSLVAADRPEQPARHAVEVLTDLSLRGYPVARALAVIERVEVREPAALDRVPALLDTLRRDQALSPAEAADALARGLAVADSLQGAYRRAAEDERRKDNGKGSSGTGTAVDGPGNSENAPGRLIKVKLPPGQAKK